MQFEISDKIRRLEYSDIIKRVQIAPVPLIELMYSDVLDNNDVYSNNTKVLKL